MTANRGLFFYYQLPDESYPRLWLMTSRTGRQRATTWEYDLTIAEQPSL
jgi:hypothetical protein